MNFKVYEVYYTKSGAMMVNCYVTSSDSLERVEELIEKYKKKYPEKEFIIVPKFCL